jgi:hypothetical protein
MRHVPERTRLAQRLRLVTEAERLHRAKERALSRMLDYLENPGNQETDPTYRELELKCGRITGHLVGTLQRLGRISGGVKYEMTYDGIIRPACGNAVLPRTIAHAMTNREVGMRYMGRGKFELIPL